jgi:hypothetical protein
MTVLSWQRLLSLCALGGVSAVSAAATCDMVARSAPNVTTIMAAPNNTARAAWILSPNCSVEIVTLEKDDDNRWKLDCSEKNIGRIESLPLDVERLCVLLFSWKASCRVHPRRTDRISLDLYEQIL